MLFAEAANQFDLMHGISWSGLVVLAGMLLKIQSVVWKVMAEQAESKIKLALLWMHYEHGGRSRAHRDGLQETNSPPIITDRALRLFGKPLVLELINWRRTEIGNPPEDKFRLEFDKKFAGRIAELAIKAGVDYDGMWCTAVDICNMVLTDSQKALLEASSNPGL